MYSHNVQGKIHQILYQDYKNRPCVNEQRWKELGGLINLIFFICDSLNYEIFGGFVFKTFAGSLKMESSAPISTTLLNICGICDVKQVLRVAEWNSSTENSVRGNSGRIVIVVV